MIEIENITKSFGNNKILNNIDISISKGEIISIIGASGTGKSTLLRCINGLEKADEGYLRIDDKRFDLKNITKKESLWIKKNTGMVFQGFYLFNNKTALENITEGLIIVKKISKKEAISIGEDILKMIGLLDKRNSYPNELSGGEQQRVAIGRAIALEPKVLLFDEPTSALDPELVNEVLLLIKKITEQKRTMIIVTHEISFAKNVSDRIIFMDGGNIVEEGPPKELIDNPREDRTKKFLSHYLSKDNL